jgi:hypothetical protein
MISNEEMDNALEKGVDYSTVLKWVDGKPTLVGVPIVKGPTDVRMKDLLMQAMNLPYEGLDPRYVGLTKGEALIIDLVDQASQGNRDARKEVLDRALGKPMQNIKSLTVRGTISDFLDGLEDPKGEIETIDVTPVDEVNDL